MTSLFPHPPYAEDQPQARQILYVHVARASAMTFSALSLITAPASNAISRYRQGTSPALTPRLLTHAYRGLVGGALLGIVMTWGRMRGKEEIEWQDRSWRLLENEGEVETDKWCGAGFVGGAAAGLWLARTGKLPPGCGWDKAILGAGGLGYGIIGTSYMVGSFASGRKER